MSQNKNACLITTEAINDSVAQDLEERLRATVSLDDRVLLGRKAAELPQYIELLGNINFWGPLAVGASAFLGQLGVRTADDIYDAVKKKFKSKRRTDIEKISEELLRTYVDCKGAISIHLAIQHSDNLMDSAIFAIDIYDPICFAERLAQVALIAERVCENLKEHPSTFGRPVIRFLGKNQATIEWMSNDMKRHSVCLQVME